MTENKCPEAFEVGQIFTWKASKGYDIVGVVTSITECFIHMNKTVRGKKNTTVDFFPESLVDHLEKGTVVWLNNKVEEETMNVGQKVLYDESAYIVAAVTGDTCSIISEEYLAVYNIAGVDIRGSGLRTFNAPDGSTSIINTDGVAVGYADLSITDVTVVEGVVNFDRHAFIGEPTI